MKFGQRFLASTDRSKLLSPKQQLRINMQYIVKESIDVTIFFFHGRRGGNRGRGRSRSRSRDRGDGFRGRKSEIDKEKLLAIAKKNAVRLLSSDNLMGMDHDRLIAIKSGGQNLRQLTDFCREIAAKGNYGNYSD